MRQFWSKYKLSFTTLMKKIIAALLLMLTITSAYAQGEANTWAIKTALGADFTEFERPERQLKLDLGIGYNLNEHVYIGFATGTIGRLGKTEAEAFFALPLLGDITFSFPTKSGWMPYIQTRGGFVVNTNKNFTNKKGQEVEGAHLTTFDVEPGLSINLSENMTLQMGIYYRRLMKLEGYGHNQNAYGAKLGLVFHL